MEVKGQRHVLHNGRREDQSGSRFPGGEVCVLTVREVLCVAGVGGVLLGRVRGHLGPVALGLDPLDGDPVGFGVKQQKEEGLQDAGHVVSLQDLVEPRPTHGAGARVPETQTVQHDEQRPTEGREG